MAANLIEALVEWADAQSSLATLFPGGIYNTDAPTGDTTPLPYLTFVQNSGKVQNIIGDRRQVSWPEVVIEARDVMAEDARTACEQTRALILAASPLTWTGGREAGRFEGSGDEGKLEAGLGPDGSDVWVHRTTITFAIARD